MITKCHISLTQSRCSGIYKSEVIRVFQNHCLHVATFTSGHSKLQFHKKPTDWFLRISGCLLEKCASCCGQAVAHATVCESNTHCWLQQGTTGMWFRQNHEVACCPCVHFVTLHLDCSLAAALQLDETLLHVMNRTPIHFLSEIRCYR